MTVRGGLRAVRRGFGMTVRGGLGAVRRGFGMTTLGSAGEEGGRSMTVAAPVCRESQSAVRARRLGSDASGRSTSISRSAVIR